MFSNKIADFIYIEELKQIIKNTNSETINAVVETLIKQACKINVTAANFSSLLYVFCDHIHQRKGNSFSLLKPYLTLLLKLFVSSSFEITSLKRIVNSLQLLAKEELGLLLSNADKISFYKTIKLTSTNDSNSLEISAFCALLQLHDTIVLEKNLILLQEEKKLVNGEEHPLCIAAENKPPVIFYDINRKEDMLELVKTQGKNKITYLFEEGKTYPPFYIAPVNALQNEYGLYAANAIPANKNNKDLDCYAGKRSTGTQASNHRSLYLFETKNGQMIDAQNERNYLAYVNHSDTANLKIYNTNLNNKEEIMFSIPANQFIPAHAQLTINYGPDFFGKRYSNFALCYLHYTDNWETPTDRYLQYKNAYHPQLQKLDSQTAKNLGYSGDFFIMPKLMAAVWHNNQEELDKLLSDTEYPVDLLLYEGTLYKINPIIAQQQITSFLFACYLGYDESIKKLINRADINRRTLFGGDNALFLLLKGSAANKTPIAKFLIAKGCSVHLLNSEKKSLLHYCIVNNETEILEAILTKIKNTKVLLNLENLFQFDDLIKQNKIKFLQKLLQAIPKSNLYKAIKEGNIFKKATFSSADYKTVQSVITTLQKEVKNKKVLEYLANCLQSRNNLEQRKKRAIKRFLANKRIIKRPQRNYQTSTSKNSNFISTFFSKRNNRQARMFDTKKKVKLLPKNKTLA